MWDRTSKIYVTSKRIVMTLKSSSDIRVKRWAAGTFELASR